MPMPLWWGHVNKRIFNPSEVRKAKRPIIDHVGRRSGKPYKTPLDAHPIEGGYIFILVYGSKCDWVQNIFHAGRADLTVDGTTVPLTAPQLIDAETTWQLIPEVKRPPGFLKINEFLQMDVA